MDKEILHECLRQAGPWFISALQSAVRAGLVDEAQAGKLVALGAENSEMMLPFAGTESGEEISIAGVPGDLGFFASRYFQSWCECDADWHDLGEIFRLFRGGADLTGFFAVLDGSDEYRECWDFADEMDILAKFQHLWESNREIFPEEFLAWPELLDYAEDIMRIGRAGGDFFSLARHYLAGFWGSPDGLTGENIAFIADFAGKRDIRRLERLLDENPGGGMPEIRAAGWAFDLLEGLGHSEDEIWEALERNGLPRWREEE